MKDREHYIRLIDRIFKILPLYEENLYSDFGNILYRFGIQTRDSDGKLRSFNDIKHEFNKAFNCLTSTEKKYIESEINDIKNRKSYLENFKKTAESMYIEMCGNLDFAEIKQIRDKIRGIYIAKVEHNAIKRTIFECISIIDKIISMIEAGM